MLNFAQPTATTSFVNSNFAESSQFKISLDQELAQHFRKENTLDASDQPPALFTFASPDGLGRLQGFVSSNSIEIPSGSINLLSLPQTQEAKNTTNVNINCTGGVNTESFVSSNDNASSKVATAPSESNNSNNFIAKSCGQNPVQPPRGKGPFSCQCGKTFAKWTIFKRHKQEHLDDKAFSCNVCTMSFNFESNLNLHKTLHRAETTGCLQCQQCPAKFSRLAGLKSHLRMHEKDEMVLCNECGDEFSTTARLNIHLGEY